MGTQDKGGGNTRQRQWCLYLQVIDPPERVQVQRQEEALRHGRPSVCWWTLYGRVHMSEPGQGQGGGGGGASERRCLLVGRGGSRDTVGKGGASRAQQHAPAAPAPASCRSAARRRALHQLAAAVGILHRDCSCTPRLTCSPPPAPSSGLAGTSAVVYLATARGDQGHRRAVHVKQSEVIRAIVLEDSPCRPRWCAS